MSAVEMESGNGSRRPEIETKAFDELNATQLLNILALRSQVFVVEQACVYNDIDGRDSDAGTRHLWIEVDGHMVAYLRLLDDGDGIARIGRVATRKTHRGKGLAADLVREVTKQHDGPLVLDAQSHLAQWYESLGFRRSGEEFVEDGIPHVPMSHAN